MHPKHRTLVALVSTIPVVLLGILALPDTAGAQPFSWRGLRFRVQRLERRVAGLGDRVAALEAAGQPREVTVDCGAGESVQAVIDDHAWNPARLTVTVVGLCDENVFVPRDDVWLRGQSPGDGFAPSGGTAISVRSARRIMLTELTVRVSGTSGSGVDASFGSELTVGALDIEGGFAGLSLFESVGHVYGTSVRNSGRGVSIRGGTFSFEVFTAEDVDLGFQVYGAGSIDVNASSVRRTSSWGISLSDRSGLRMFNTTIEDGLAGVFLSTGSMALIGGGSVIRDSGAQDIRAWSGSTVLLGGGAIVETSAADGVMLQGGATLLPYQTEIRNNSGNGVTVLDTSIAQGGDQTQILSNAGWGVSCASAPAVAQVLGPGYLPALVTGNALGATNCPSLGDPGRIP